MIKQKTEEGLLPFLSQTAEANHYLRIENAACQVSFTGLNETVRSIFGKQVYEDQEALSIAEEIVKELLSSIQESAKKSENRVTLSLSSDPLASKRLAELDVKKYGWEDVQVQGTKENPLYTDNVIAPLQAPIPWRERLSIEERFHKLTPGGHVAIIQLAASEQDPEELLSTTKHLTKTYGVGLYAYNRNIHYCVRCRKTFFELLSKCPLCGSVNTLVSFSRMSTKYLPTSSWIPAKLLALKKRKSYVLTME
jgi:ribonucleoside-triphosphate reductase